MRFGLVLVFLLLAGCGHLTFNLRAHEEDHCVEFGVLDRSLWVYHYASAAETSRVCREMLGLVFVSGCAGTKMTKNGVRCFIFLPRV